MRRAAILLPLALAGCEAATTGAQNWMAPASGDARLMAALSWWFFTVAAAVWIVTMGLLAAAMALRRGRDPAPLSRRRAMALAVGGGVVAPVLAIIGLTFSGVVVASETETEAGREVAPVEVLAVGKQWWWEFTYLRDGEPLFVTANELRLPAGARTRILLESDNVIHSFWAPNLQGKTDMIPGKRTQLFAEPEAAGVWRGQCAEFCGVQHALMGFEVVAEPPEAFDRWLSAQAEPARAPADHPGLAVFQAAGCAECHDVRGLAEGEGWAPDLTHLASRRTIGAAVLPNTRGNLGGWITSTQHVKPGAKMPAIAPEPQDLFALLDFLEALE